MGEEPKVVEQVTLGEVAIDTAKKERSNGRYQ